MCFSVVYVLKIEELKECFARFPELKGQSPHALWSLGGSQLASYITAIVECQSGRLRERGGLGCPGADT